MRRHRNVKIVATLGPASSDYQTIKALHEAGADVFRLNMSHGSHAEIEQRHKYIRMVEKELNSPIAILADLQGPKLRVGEFANGSEELENGHTSDNFGFFTSSNNYLRDLSNACLRSLIKSSASSIPIEIRTISGPVPAAFCCSVVSCR